MKTRSLILWVAITFIALVGTLSACGQAGGASERSATLVGGITYSGGPVSLVSPGPAPGSGGISRQEPGRVIVRDAGGRKVAAERVRRGQRFRLHVAPGRYKLIAHTDHMRCRHSAHARADRTTRANVVCSIP
jgi:hypothetical protein